LYASYKAPTVSPFGGIGFPDAAVRRFEQLVRRWYSVHEYTGDPDCIFRIAFRMAQSDVILGDGTFIQPGDAIVELHLWNEHLPRIDYTGADIAWGARIDRRARRSFRLLAAYLAAYPEIVAVYGEAAFGCQMGHRQRTRFAGHYGFEIVDSKVSLRGRVRHCCDDFLFWGLTRTFNPRSLKGKRFHRRRHDIWTSRTEFNRRWQGVTRP
jgi:hypothetical protein